MNPYHVLEVSLGAEFAEIRAAYRRLARVHHPDRAGDDAARAASSERMVKINWAWHILSDSQRRAAFDARFELEQAEQARRQQESLRASERAHGARARQAHLSDVAQVQSRRGEPNHSTQTPQQRERQQQFLAWQAAERARQERVKRAKEGATRPVRPRTAREEKQRESQARARLRRVRREDKKRGAAPSARRQLTEAARLFAHEARAGDAIAICHDVLRIDARNVPARELLGDFYLQLGRQDRALPLWEQALALQPDNSSVRRKLGALRPHQAQNYRPQPSLPRASSKSHAPRASAAPLNFWSRVRDAFKSGL